MRFVSRVASLLREVMLRRRWRPAHSRVGLVPTLTTVSYVALQIAILTATPCLAQLVSRPLLHNGYSRPYLIYQPAKFPPHPAVVIMLGGTGSTARFAAENFGWTQLGDRNNFLVVFPEPTATDPSRPADSRMNPTFWDLKGSRTHLAGAGMQPVDDDGYLLAVLKDVLHLDHPNRKQIFLAGFSSGSGMVQLFAAHHAQYVSGVVAVATPLMEPPVRLAHPVPILYIHGDLDEQFSGFEVNSPHFATTPHGNWITWGYLNDCHVQQAEKVDDGVRFSWRQCKAGVPVLAYFIEGLGHEWPGSLDSRWNESHDQAKRLDFTTLAWQFFGQLAVGTAKS